MRGLIVRVVLLAAALMGTAVVLTLTLTSNEGVDPDLISKSVDLANDAESAQALFTFTLEAPPGFEDQAVSFGGGGEFDFANRRSRTTIEFTAALGGDGLDPTVPEQLQMEVLTDADKAYLRVPSLSRQVPGAPEWFAVDFDELARVTGKRSLGLGASDPSQTLEYLRGASKDLEEIGAEPVRGEDATHYRARVDLDRAVSLAPEAQRSLVGDAVAQFKSQFGTAEFPVDVWIDGDGLPRRLRYELDLADYDASGEVPEGAIMSFTMELFNFGTPVTIEPPPANQVGDLAAILERAQLPQQEG